MKRDHFLVGSGQHRLENMMEGKAQTVGGLATGFVFRADLNEFAVPESELGRERTKRGVECFNLSCQFEARFFAPADSEG